MTKVTFVRGTSEQFELENPIIPDGKVVICTDTGDIRLGDGETQYNQLPSLFKSIQALEQRLDQLENRS